MLELTPLPVADPLAELPARETGSKRISVGMRVATIVFVVVPILGVLAAAVFLWGWGFSWSDMGLLIGTYVLTTLGISIGYHRLFTHRSFETNAAIQLVLAILGSMAIEGAMLKWVAIHRRHHQYSDQPEDPHSPHHQGRGLLGLLRGLWHAHMGWLFRPDPPDLDRYIKDLQESRLLRVASALFPVWAALGFIVPAVLGGLLMESWNGVWRGLIWGGLVRVFLVHHVTWSVNSVCHMWGLRPYESGDESRDNVVFGILGMGEGWHHTHHTFPSSARHGLRWWQLDVSYWVIRGLALLGLARKVKVPTREAQAARRAPETTSPRQGQLHRDGGTQ
jgi:stearoyl-CoA desaturase (delta-9 desaturase)